MKREAAHLPHHTNNTNCSPQKILGNVDLMVLGNVALGEMVCFNHAKIVLYIYGVYVTSKLFREAEADLEAKHKSQKEEEENMKKMLSNKV